MFWNFLEISQPGGQKTETSMWTINTFKQGHAFLIKWLQKQSEPMGGLDWEGGGGGVGGAPDQPIKGTSVMNKREKRRKKELGKGGEGEKKKRK